MVHRQLALILEGRAEGAMGEEEVAAIAKHCNDKRNAAKAAQDGSSRY